MTPAPVRHRSWVAVRWRQFRNAPRPIVRAVMSNLAVASAAGVALLAYDVAVSRGWHGPGGDLRTLGFAAFVLLVILAGSALTYLWVPLPTGTGTRARRTGWSAMLGFFASLPIAYIVLVVAFQIIRPLLG